MTGAVPSEAASLIQGNDVDDPNRYSLLGSVRCCCLFAVCLLSVRALRCAAIRVGFGPGPSHMSCTEARSYEFMLPAPESASATGSEEFVTPVAR